MNGATEATLQELLAVVQEQLKQQILLKKMYDEFKRAGGMGGPGVGAGAMGGAASALGGLTKAITPVGLAFGAISLAGKALGAAFDVMGSVLGKVVDGLGKTASNLIDFSFQAMQGKVSVEAFVNVFKDLPFFIGDVIGMFAKLIGYEEKLLETYRDLTKYGASFSGDLFKMQQMAFSAYMTLDEFGRVIKENSELFSTAIGGVEAGARMFSEAQAKLMNPNGPFGRDIAGLGIRAREAGDMMAYYMKLQGNMGRVGQQSTDEMAKGMHDLFVSTDALSKLTGANREQLEKDMRDQAFNKRIQAHLASLPMEEAKKQTLIFAAALKLGGEGFRDDVAVRYMTNNMIKKAGTEASNNLSVLTGGLDMASAEILYGAKEFALGSEGLTRSIAQSQAGLGKAYGDQQTLFGGGSKMALLEFMQALSIPPELMESWKRTTGDLLSADEKAIDIRKRQEEQFLGNASQLGSLQEQFKRFGMALGELVSRVFQPVGVLVTNWVSRLINWATDKNGKITEAFDKVIQFVNAIILPAMIKIADWFVDTFNYLEGSADTKDFWEKVGKKLKEGAANVWEVVKPAFIAIWEEMKPIIVEGFLQVFDAILDAIVPGKKKLRDLNENTLIQNQKANNNYINRAQQQLGEGKSFLEYDKLAKALKEKDIAFRKEVGVTQDTEDLEAGKAMNQAANRSTGSWGSTGKLLENFGTGTPAMLHGNEGVITEDQLNQVMSYAMKSGNENKSAVQLDRLNMLMIQLIAINKEQAEYIRKNVDATNGLNGNLFSV